MSSTRSEREMFEEPVLTIERAGMDPVRATILLVEDEDFVRQVTAEVLSFGGYQVFGARTAAEAMRVFRQQRRKSAAPADRRRFTGHKRPRLGAGSAPLTSRVKDDVYLRLS